MMGCTFGSPSLNDTSQILNPLHRLLPGNSKSPPPLKESLWSGLINAKHSLSKCAFREADSHNYVPSFVFWLLHGVVRKEYVPESTKRWTEKGALVPSGIFRIGWYFFQWKFFSSKMAFLNNNNHYFLEAIVKHFKFAQKMCLSFHLSLPEMFDNMLEIFHWQKTWVLLNNICRYHHLYSFVKCFAIYE